MSDPPPRLEYASPPPDAPAQPRRIALGSAGAVLYAVLLVPVLLAFVVAATVAVPRGDYGGLACSGLALAVVAWRLTAAVRHVVGGLARRRRRG